MAMETTVKRTDIIVLVFVVLLAIVVRCAFLEFTIDDAYITLRYAENIARGNGFVYNPGEHVYGTTTPLLTFILAAFSRMTQHALLAGKILNILADAAVAVMLFGFAGRFGGSRWVGYLAALLYGLNPIPIKWSASGMETGLYIFLICLSFWQYERQRFRAAYIFAALATLTRIDGALIFGVLLTADIVHRRRGLWTDAVIGAFPLLLWAGFALLYFGSPIPHSAWAKRITYGGHAPLEAFGEILRKLLFRHGAYSAIAAIPAFIGMFWITVRRRRGWPMVAWWFGYWAFFVLTGSKLQGWYLAPAVWVYTLSTALGVGIIARIVVEKRLSSWARAWFARPALAIGALTVISVSMVLIRERYVEEKSTIGTLEGQVSRPIGLWLAEHAAPTDTVCLESIGAVGYYSGLYILDEVGLVSPAVVPFNQQTPGTPNFGGIVRAFTPTYYVWWESWEQQWWRSRPKLMAWLDSAYTRQAVFSGPGTAAWAIWRRK